MVAFKEHDAVVLSVDLPANGLKQGMVGTIVHVFSRPRLAYEVEFCDKMGRTIAQLALTPDQVIPHQPV